MHISKKQVLVTSAGVVVAALAAWGLAAASDASATSGAPGPAVTAKAPDGRPSHDPAAEKAATIAKGGSGTAQEGGLLTEPGSAAALAATLGVPEAAARTALTSLAAIDGGHGLEPDSAQFRAVADQLGVSAPQLAHAIATMKMAG